MDLFKEQLEKLKPYIQISPHKRYGEIAGVSVADVVGQLGGWLGVESGALRSAMKKKIPVFNGKGIYDLNPPYLYKPPSPPLWGRFAQTVGIELAVTSPIILNRVIFVNLYNEYVLSYYRAEDKIIAALQAAEHGDIAACIKHCELAQAEILSAIKRRNTRQCKFRQAMENLYTKPSLNGFPREKPPQSDDDAVQRSFRNFQSKITTALTAARLQRIDICEKYCRESLNSVSIKLLKKLEEVTRAYHSIRRDGA